MTYNKDKVIARMMGFLLGFALNEFILVSLLNIEKPEFPIFLIIPIIGAIIGNTNPRIFGIK